MVDKLLKIKHCAWPYCEKEAKFPAPCDPRDLRKRIHLCQEHIIQYNKAWNGLDGFDAEEIFNMQGNPAWDMPTWKLGEKQKMQESVFSFTHSSDKKTSGHDFFEDESEQGSYMPTDLRIPQEVLDAMEVLYTDEPLDAIKVKKAYKKQVKLNHPDKLKDSKQAEEKLKEINLAYDRIKSYLKIKKIT